MRLARFVARGCWLTWALVLAVLLMPRPASAYTLEQLLRSRLDPALEYRTRGTPHFWIHHPRGLEDVAEEVARLAEEAHVRVTSALGTEPGGKTHVVLAWRSDQPDTFTFVHPHPQLFLDVALPHLGMGMNDFTDWYGWLVTHEYTHIVHLDARQGFARPLSALLGSWLRPNLTTPAWVKEGIAVYLESTLTPRGRGGSSLYRMMARVAVAEGVLETPGHAAPDTVANYGRTQWPWAVRPYLFGYFLIRTLASRSPKSLARFVAGTAGAGPYALEPGLKQAGAGSFEALWRQTLAGLREESREEFAQLERAPRTPLQYLTESGFHHSGLTVSPDGRWLLVSRQRPDEDDAILRFPLDGDSVGAPQVVTSRSTGYQSSLSRSGRFLVFDQSRRTRHQLVSDLYIYDLKTRDFAAISPGLHARDADVHPDGLHLAFVANEAGRNRLLSCDTAWEDVRDLLGDVGRRRISAPRFSPDGTSLVTMLHNPETGGEDLVLVDEQGARVLLADGARNLAPSWTPDGRYLLYASDLDGVFNLYALELATHLRYRLTHVLGGLFYPVVDPAQRWIYAVSYRATGYDVARLRWAPDTWVPLEPAPPPGPLPSPERSLAPGEGAPAGGEPSTPYQGWRGLAPQYLLPSVLLRPDTFQVGVEVGAVDPLFFQHYALTLRYDSATRLPVGRFFYFDGRWPWGLDAELTHDAVPIADTGRRLRSLAGSVGLHLPLGAEDPSFWLSPRVGAEQRSDVARSLYLSAGLELVSDTQFRQLGYSFHESGSLLRLGGRVLWDAHRGGAPPVSLDFTLRTHQPLPWKRHVLHLEAVGSVFVWGRDAPNSVVYAGGQASFPFGLRSPFLLQGYAPLALASPQVAVATAHYTFPLLELERGLGTLPLFLRRTSGGLQLQAAALDSLRPERLPLSAGVELHQELLLGDLFSLSARLGLYQALPRLGGGTQLLFSLASTED